jgi:hypothetical protein
VRTLLLLLALGLAASAAWAEPVDELRAAFAAAAGRVRLVTLLSPT